jgi:transcription initiation factor TFIIB
MCNKAETAITDSESGEVICSNCSVVISDKTQDYSHQEWRAFTAEKSDKRTRTGGAPTSLSCHDRGLATIKGREDKDVAGQKLDTTMRSTFERLRI